MSSKFNDACLTCLLAVSAFFWRWSLSASTCITLKYVMRWTVRCVLQTNDLNLPRLVFLQLLLVLLHWILVWWQLQHHRSYFQFDYWIQLLDSKYLQHSKANHYNRTNKNRHNKPLHLTLFYQKVYWLRSIEFEIDHDSCRLDFQDGR